MKFQLGDRVRITASPWMQRLGVIKGADHNSSFPYRVLVDNIPGCYAPVNEDELELVQTGLDIMLELVPL